MAVLVPRIPISLVVGLINEWAATPQEVSPRPWRGYPAEDSALRQGLQEAWPADLKGPDDTIIASACDQIYPVFAADGPEDAAALLNEVIVKVDLKPHVDSADSTVHVGWSTGDFSQFMTAMLVASVIDHMDNAPQERFGICASATCADVLVDQSPTHTKHFCSIRCQTRERVRAHRARTAG